MEASKQLSTIRRMSSSVILKALKSKRSIEEKELMITVLKQRNVEISAELLVAEQFVQEKEAIKETVGVVKPNVKPIIPKKVSEQHVEQSVKKSKRDRSKGRLTRDSLSDFDLKKGDLVLFSKFRTTEKIVGLLKRIYQCKRTGFVYACIEVQGKFFFKRASTIERSL